LPYLQCHHTNDGKKSTHYESDSPTGIKAKDQSADSRSEKLDKVSKFPANSALVPDSTWPYGSSNATDIVNIKKCSILAQQSTEPFQSKSLRGVMSGALQKESLTGSHDQSECPDSHE
jgi:hypothetical protein